MLWNIITGLTKVFGGYPVPKVSLENQLVWFFLPGLHVISNNGTTID